jgi:hypothetical protein
MSSNHLIFHTRHSILPGIGGETAEGDEQEYSTFSPGEIGEVTYQKTIGGQLFFFSLFPCSLNIR